MGHVSYQSESVLKRGPMGQCSGCGRVYEKLEEHDTHCCDCRRLIRLGIPPKRQPTRN